ncbi:MAG TPA: hypothetical protein DCY07_06990, partial [Rhodospirillaceae bacterium]|nr:hypothetical protein [Rhodospirillaceae bacterium]
MTAADGGTLESKIMAADGTLSVLRDRILPDLKAVLPAEKIAEMSRSDVNREIKALAVEFLSKQGIELNLLDQRDFVNVLSNAILGQIEKPAPVATASNASSFVPADAPEPEPPPPPPRHVEMAVSTV